MNKNLYERFNNGEFPKVGTKKLNWQGRNVNFDVVKVNIDELKYNVLNGRIAELDLTSKTILDDATYKDIKQTIMEGSITDIEKLALDIGSAKLKEPLIVNRNGIIVDGNRRYTAINMLLDGEVSPKNPTDITDLEFVEIVILDADSNEKSVKMLEYSIQFDNMKKEYDPISRQFDFARANKVQGISVSEISAATGIKETEINKEIRSATLIRVFLAATGEKNNIKLAIELKLDGLFKEIASNVRKTEFYLQNQRALVDIVTLAIKEGGDRTRFVRDIVKGHDSKNFETDNTVKAVVKKMAEETNVAETIKQTQQAGTIAEKIEILKSVSKDSQNKIKKDRAELVSNLLDAKTNKISSRRISGFVDFLEKEVNAKKLTKEDEENLRKIQNLINGILS